MPLDDDPRYPQILWARGRSIAWVLKSSEHQLVLSSCDVDKRLFKESDELKEGDKVYVVLDKVSKPEDKEQLSFGIKVVNKEGKELGAKSTNALIVTENGAGLVHIKGWYDLIGNGTRGDITERLEETLKGVLMYPKFQITASEVDTWLKGGADIDGGDWGKIKNKEVKELMDKDGKPKGEYESLFGNWLNGSDEEMKKQKILSLFHSKWFETKVRWKNGGRDATIGAEWVSWCGTDSNKRDKRLDDGSRIGGEKIGAYKKASSEVKLRAGSVPSSTKDDIWAFIPLYKPVIKIKLPKGNMNNETIQGTLEPMNDSFTLNL